VSATNVARAGKRGNICVGNNVSSFARAFTAQPKINLYRALNSTLDSLKQPFKHFSENRRMVPLFNEKQNKAARHFLLNKLPATRNTEINDLPAYCAYSHIVYIFYNAAKCSAQL